MARPQPAASGLAARVLVLLSALLSVASGQQQILDFSAGALPSCAQTCTLLQQAQSACLGSPAGLKSCFCLSGYLTTLYQSPSGICDTVCPQQSDVQQIQSWYLGVCSSTGVVGVGAAPSTTAAPAAATTTAATTNGQTVQTPTATLANPSSTAGAASGGSTASKGSWWSGHWQWIVMLIVILIGLALFAFLLTWLKRRYARKQAFAEKEKSGGDGIVWGPHQNQHSTGGIAYPDTSSVGNGNRLSGMSAASTMMSSRGGDFVTTEPVPPVPTVVETKDKGRARDEVRPVDAGSAERPGSARGGKRILKKLGGH